MRAVRSLLSTAVVGALIFSVRADPPKVIFSNVLTSPTSNLPGVPGSTFRHNPPNSPTFGRPFGSPDGQRWVFRALGFNGASGFQAIVAGGGTNGTTSSVVLRAGLPAFFDGTVVYGAIHFDVSVNDVGSFAFSCDTTAPAETDEIAARWTADSGFELVSREGTQAPDQAVGVGCGASADSVHIRSDGRVAFRAPLTDSPDTVVFDNFRIDDGTALIQTGLTIPDNQLPPAQPLSLMGDFRSDATGENYLYGGFISGVGDIITVNNSIVARHGMALPGGEVGFFVDPDIFDAGESVSPYNGHFAFRGPADLDLDGYVDADVVVVDDRVVAGTGEPIVPGSGEVYWNFGTESPFFLNIVNSRGDYFISGGSSGPAGLSAVHVLNGTTVILRDREPIDLNGDGLANDNVYLGNIATDAAYLTDDGRLYFSGRLANAADTMIGEAFMWLPVPVRGELNCDGRIDFFDIDPFLLALFDPPAYAAAYPDCWRITADINRDGNVDFFDIDPFIECLFAACP